MDLHELWQAVLGELEVEQSKASFRTWFKSTQLVEINNDQVIVSVPTSFAKEWLEQKFHKQLKSIINRHLGSLCDITYQIGAPRVVPQPQIINRPESVISSPATQLNPLVIKKEYTFDSFVVGQSNRLAHATAKAVSEKPGQLHNPLFIYGGVGLGKTHLIHAVGNAVVNLKPMPKILYVSCEDFATEFIQSIQKKQMEPFKKKYRSVDIFLIDDIQFLSKKEGTQEEFFHTFNTLHQKKAQIVMTSDRLPRAIPDLEDRLSSRFGWGMVADITPPNYETRLAILKAKCQDKSTEIPENVLIYIAERVKTNIRDLEGSLNRLIAYCDLQQIQPTEQITAMVLDQLIQSTFKSNATPSSIINLICEYFGINEQELTSKKRSRNLVYPRQISMYLLRSELSLSYPMIGKILGGKDHTTIIHGFETINTQLTRNEQLKNDITLLKQKITNMS